MTIIFFAAFLINSSFGLTPCVQTIPKVKPSPSVSKKQQPSIRYHAGQNSYPTQARLLQGVWSECSDCNADFTIKGSQVIFYDPGTDGKPDVTYWKISNNKLSFIYKGGSVVTDAIIKLTKDSLVLYRRDKEAGVVGYSRFVRLK
jgi:hypothetical protein